MNPVFDYSIMQEVLKRVDSKKDPSEVHGILCGLLCAGPAADPELWMDLLLQDTDPQDLLLDDALAHIRSLQQLSLEQINDPTCNFHLLIPGEEYSLEDKIMALGDWCQGFLFGLNAAGVTDLESLPDDSHEIIKDMLEIGSIGLSYDYSDNNDDENAFEQFVEYVRIGVLLIYEELHPDSAAIPTVH